MALGISLHSTLNLLPVAEHAHQGAVAQAAEADLATEAAVVGGVEEGVEHVELFVGGFVGAAFEQLDVAGGAQSHAAASSQYGVITAFEGFHEAEAHVGGETVLGAAAVGLGYKNADVAHQNAWTPFTVVYLKLSFWSGYTNLKALCTMRAASWKPHRMSLSLPG